MKKIFTFFAAALLSVSLWAQEQQDSNREYISLDPAVWGWGYNCDVTPNPEDGSLTAGITNEWGALSTGWDPERDLTEWDKIVIVVDNMSGCDGNWFKLKAYLRDHSESEANQMEGLLGLDAVDDELNYLVIDLHQEKEGFDLTQCRILAIQCQPAGAHFTISSVYLLKEGGEEGFENTAISEKSVKRIVNGQLLIEKNGKFYNALGAEMK